ncbi:MAG: hypothetical protein PVG32_17130, partial [Anaerolineales bacterium]
MSSNTIDLQDFANLAQGFANALDADDFESSSEFLDADCQYRIGDAIHRGRDAIIQSYQKGSEKAKALFEQVKYDSEVLEVRANTATILFFEHLMAKGKRQEYRLQQRLTYNDQGRIIK